MVARRAAVFAFEKVIETNFIQTGRRSERRKVTADTFGFGVRTHDHDGSIPANVSANSSLEMFVARKPRFVFRRNAVDVRRRNRRRKTDLTCTRTF